MTATGKRVLLWGLPLAFLVVFFFVPMARILALGLSAPLTAGWETLRQTLAFTFWQAILSTLLTLGLGLPAAWLFTHIRFRGAAALRTLTAIPFIMPTVVVAAGFSAFLGPRGWVNLGLMRWLGLSAPPLPFVGTLAAILTAHVFYNTTIVIRLVGAAWGGLPPSLEAAASTLGASPARVFRTVTLPLLRPSILAAALLVFLFDFTSFGVVLLLGGTQYATLEVEIYIQAMHLLNLPLAALLSLVQLGCTFLVSLLYTRLAGRQAQVMPASAETRRRRPQGLRQKIWVGGLTLFLWLFFSLPLLALPLRSVVRVEADRGQRGDVTYGLTLDYYRELFVNRRGSLFYVPPVEAVKNSLTYAGATVALSLALGFPAAWALAHPGRLEKALDPWLMLPLGASAVTLGLGYILTFGRPPLALISSRWLLPLAHTTIALPFVIRQLTPALAAIPRRLREAAAVLGASPWQVWRTVDWPILSRATLAAAVFAFTLSLGEFGATALLARPEYPTLPLAVYRFLSQPGGLNYGQAMAMATLLMLITAAGIATLERLRLPGQGEF